MSIDYRTRNDDGAQVPRLFKAAQNVDRRRGKKSATNCSTVLRCALVFTSFLHRSVRLSTDVPTGGFSFDDEAKKKKKMEARHRAFDNRC